MSRRPDPAARPGSLDSPATAPPGPTDPPTPLTRDRNGPPAGRLAARVLLGSAVFGTGLWLLARDVEGWNAAWYVPAWFGYLLLVDALLLRRRGLSYLTDRRRELAAMMLWSVPFWLLHEAYNLRLENWYYVFTLRGWAPAALFTALAFATVLPACLLHAELLAALGFGRAGRRLRGITVGPGLRAVWAVLGVACVVLPLIWPRRAFPLVWGAALWLPDLLAWRAGAPSLLGDLEHGSAGRTARLLVGGLWGGVVWELFNYPARCKWIYTVPGLEGAKLAEMPVLGFLGFPVLALTAFSFYSALSHFVRAGRRWELDQSPGPKGDRSRALRWGPPLLAAALSVGIYAAVRAQPEHSVRPLLGELESLNAADVERLRAAGIPTPERLEAAIAAQSVESIAARAGVPVERLERAGRHAALAVHKGMGSERARLLLAAGVGGVVDLDGADPQALQLRLVELARERGGHVPRVEEVRVWIRAAAPDGRPRR